MKIYTKQSSNESLGYKIILPWIILDMAIVDMTTGYSFIKVVTGYDIFEILTGYSYEMLYATDPTSYSLVFMVLLAVWYVYFFILHRILYSTFASLNLVSDFEVMVFGLIGHWTLLYSLRYRHLEILLTSSVIAAVYIFIYMAGQRRTTRSHERQERAQASIPLHAAANRGRTEEVRRLLLDGMDADERIMQGMTPLMLAAKGGHPGVMRVLLGAGADPNASNHHGKTPLMFAVGSGSVDSVRLLLEQSVDVNARNQQGLTALSFVQNGPREVDAELAQLLKRAGATV